MVTKPKHESIKPITEMTNDELKDKQEIPAYMRKGIKLKETPPNSQNLSRFTLNENEDAQ